MATEKTGPKVQQFMNGRYKGMPVSRRMDLAVKAVLDGRYNVSESARQHGVTRARLSEQVGEKRRALADMDSRSKAAAAARQVETAPAPVIEPVTEGTVVPKLEVTGEARRIPPFPEFVRKYFGTLECPDCGRHHELPDFHVEMMEALAGPDKRLLVNMPPYHSKSTVATVQHTVYELCRDPNTRVLVVSKSQKLAERFLYQITKYLSDPNVYPDDANLLLDWGPFNTGGEQWNKQQLYIAGRQSAEKDPSVSALGVGGHIYGIRADTIKFDDIADLENQRNAERVKEMLTWCTQEAASRVGRNGKLQFIGTRISAGDIYSYLQDLPSFKTVRYPCILDEEKKLTLWPDHFPFDSAALQRESMSIEQWQLVYQNVDTPGFGASFPPEVVEATYDASRPLGHYDPRWALVAGLDPAGANSQSGYTALVLVGVDLQSGMRYLVDLVAVKQMKAPQLRDQIFDWADKYPLRELRVESNGLQSQLVQYNQEILGHLTSRGTRVVPHITTGHNKWDPQFGVESMASMFINRQISLPTQDVASRNRIRPLVEQLQAFPMGAVSDLVMAFWFAELGIRETFQRASLPMFDPRMRLPNRVASKRRVFDFAERTVKGAPAVEPAWGRPMFPNSEPATEHKLVNVSGSVFVP